MKFDRFGPTSTRVLLAVITQPRPTVNSIRDAVGLHSSSTVHYHLARLRSAGLVSWTEGQQGTLRPLVEVVS